jgi:hypothetical protein
VILDGKAYAIASLEDSDCYEVGTRFVSLSLVELSPYEMDEADARFG